MNFDADQLLKFRLLADGARVSVGATSAWMERFGGPLTLAEYATTNGISLVLPGALYVNAPISADAGPELRHDGETFFLVADGREVPVGVIPVPAFHERQQTDVFDGARHPYTDYGVTHTDRVRVSPIGGCAWKCHFCDLPYEFSYHKKHEQNLLEVIRAAKDDPLAPARHVLISGGTPRAPVAARGRRPATDDQAWIDGVYAHIAEQSPLPVDVMMAPRRHLDYPAWLRGAGVNMVSINLEVSDPDRARKIAPVKSKLGRDHTMAYIERAVEAFEVGFVQSLVVFGEAIEPIQSTLRGVEDLVRRGCIPVLSAFRPHHLTPLRDEPAASFAEMVEVYTATLEICDRVDNGVRPGPRCIACHHNTVTLHDASDFYTGSSGDLTERGCLAC
jgi:hypothetical protein